MNEKLFKWTNFQVIKISKFTNINFKVFPKKKYFKILKYFRARLG